MNYFDSALESIWDEQPSTEDPGVFLEWFRGRDEMQRVLFPTHLPCAEVYNGGFHQYFSNSTGMHAPEAIAGLRQLRLNDIAELVEEAVSVFGDHYPRERETREAFLNSIKGSERWEWDPFFQIDDRFYELIKIPDAAPLHDDQFTLAANALIESARAPM